MKEFIVEELYERGLIPYDESIVLAEGFEEVEVVTPIDILRRAGVDVIVAGLKSDCVTGAHGLSIKTDTILDNIKELPDVFSKIDWRNGIFM